VGEKGEGSGACLVGDGVCLGSRWPACGCAGVRGVVLGEVSGSERGGRGRTRELTLETDGGARANVACTGWAGRRRHAVDGAFEGVWA